MKTFEIMTAEGPRAVTQLATFAHYIQNEQFRFVVTRDGLGPMVVTHRGSGKRVCEVTPTVLAACCFDKVQAGKLALSKLCEAKGEARVRSVLAAAEVTHA